MPQSSSDFIFAIIIEEYGLIGGMCLLFLYLWLLFRIVIVAQKSETVFGKLLSIGVGIPIIFQALVNMGVAVELFPVTGQTLPLISSGGTSIWVTCLALGIVLSVSAKRDAEKSTRKRRTTPFRNIKRSTIMKAYKIILSGGGTGGHIYPAIAIANELKARFPKSEFLFVGAKDKMEMQKVPQAGYAIKGLWISGIQRRLTFKNLLFPLKLVVSLLKSMAIVNAFKPDVVIGTGGFASGPLLLVAAMKGVPTLIQEQNSFPGITNKLLSKKVNKVCVAYEGLERFFPKEKLILTGNPVRQDLLDLDQKSAEAQAFFNLDPNKKTLLVLGGSLGARRMNQLIESELDFFRWFRGFRRYGNVGIYTPRITIISASFRECKYIRS